MVIVSMIMSDRDSDIGDVECVSDVNSEPTKDYNAQTADAGSNNL